LGTSACLSSRCIGCDVKNTWAAKPEDMLQAFYKWTDADAAIQADLPVGAAAACMDTLGRAVFNLGE